MITTWVLPDSSSVGREIGGEGEEHLHGLTTARNATGEGPQTPGQKGRKIYRDEEGKLGSTSCG